MNPDFYVALLFTRLMGRHVLHTEVAQSPSEVNYPLRAYPITFQGISHCIEAFILTMTHTYIYSFDYNIAYIYFDKRAISWIKSLYSSA